jgi:hypothetical protein
MEWCTWNANAWSCKAEDLQIVWAHYARCYGKQQLDYIMGSSGRSFVSGWGVNPPKKPHHRGAFCDYLVTGNPCLGWPDWYNKNHTFPNTLPGGLVAGPNNLLDEWIDDHVNFETNEVATDFNSGLIGGTHPSRDGCCSCARMRCCALFFVDYGAGDASVVLFHVPGLRYRASSFTNVVASGQAPWRCRSCWYNGYRSGATIVQYLLLVLTIFWFWLLEVLEGPIHRGE